MVKGISEVVAMVLMLVITLALAGTAYVFISRAFREAQQGIKVELADCIADPNNPSVRIVTIQIRNTGNDILSSLTVTRRAPSSPSWTASFTNLAPGNFSIFQDTNCPPARTCSYLATPSAGNPVPFSVTCP